MPTAKLSAKAVIAARTPGYYSDGGGLYLQVTASTKTRVVRKSWVFRYTHHGRQREMGLGPLLSVSLAEARKLAEDVRRVRASGQDPIAARKAAQAGERSAQEVTFEHVATEFIANKRPGWRNAKHADQWTSTLRKYVYPVFGNVPVDQVDTDMVSKVLQPIWHPKTETAKRVRSRIDQILASAKVRGLRSGDNPAQWKGHLDAILNKPSKIRKVRNHAALPYTEAPAFVRKLRARPGGSARALEFTILTAGRTGEVIGAKWSELNLSAKTWTVPAERMKDRKEHVVPLSDGAMAVLEGMTAVKPADDDGYIFPGERAQRPLSNMAMLKQIERMGLKHAVTTHGFRSTFRDWAEEQSSHPGPAAEKALAHAVGNKVVSAYLRGNLLEKRSSLMSEWDAFLRDPPLAD